MKTIKQLDGLRLIFAISVVLNHCRFLKENYYTDLIFENIFHHGGFGVVFFLNFRI